MFPLLDSSLQHKSPATKTHRPTTLHVPPIFLDYISHVARTLFQNRIERTMLLYNINQHLQNYIVYE